MYDRELVIEILKNIGWALEQVTKRFQVIRSSDDCVKNDIMIENLDSICMQLINIGEAIKQIDKLTNSKLLSDYPDIDWKKVKGMRDIITHHYFDIDAEIVYAVCSEHIPVITRVIDKIIADRQNEDISKDERN